MPRRWRAGLSRKLVRQITAAVEQAQADAAYEKLWPLKQALGALRMIDELATPLLQAVRSLSPVAAASIWEVSKRTEIKRDLELLAIWEGAPRRRRAFGRSELRVVTDHLEVLAQLAGKAAETLEAMHSPSPDQGQGSRSAIGRDSDLRAIPAGYDTSGELPPSRSPRDKFAVSVIRALVSNNHPVVLTNYLGQRRDLETLLTDIWVQSGLGLKPNWKTISEDRRKIIEWAVDDFERFKQRKPTLEKRRARAKATERKRLRKNSKDAS